MPNQVGRSRSDTVPGTDTLSLQRIAEKPKDNAVSRARLPFKQLF